MREASAIADGRSMAETQGATPPAWIGRSRWRLFRDVVGGLRQNWDKLRQLISLLSAYFRPGLVRRRLERLRALGHVAQTVNSTLDLEQVLSTIVAHAAARSFLQQVIDRRWTLAPDALEQKRHEDPKPVKFDFVAVDRPDGRFAGLRLELDDPHPAEVGAHSVDVAPHFRDDLGRIDVPTLVIHGDDDQVVPIGVGGLRSSKLIKNATLAVYQGAPHGLMSTHQERFNNDLLSFVRQTSRAAAA